MLHDIFFFQINSMIMNALSFFLNWSRLYNILLNIVIFEKYLAGFLSNFGLQSGSAVICLWQFLL